MIMRGLSITAFAVAAVAITLYIAPSALAQQRKPSSKKLIHIGFLNCDVASGWGLVFGSSRKLRCTYSTADKSKNSEHYTGSISRVGTDIGYLQSGVILWSVYASRTEITTNPGFLTGSYQGQTASATLGEGMGLRNAMVRTKDESIELRPVSIEGNKGLNLAAGVATIILKFSPAPSTNK
jgi:hypothetical protein